MLGKEKVWDVPRGKEIVIRCEERQCMYVVVLTNNSLYWRKRLLFTRYDHAALGDLKVRVRVGGKGDYGFQIAFWLQVECRSAATILFSFFPRDPINWIKHLQETDVPVEDEFHLPEHTILVWLRNNFDMVIVLSAVVLFFAVLSLL